MKTNTASNPSHALSSIYSLNFVYEKRALTNSNNKTEHRIDCDLDSLTVTAVVMVSVLVVYKAQSRIKFKQRYVLWCCISIKLIFTEYQQTIEQMHFVNFEHYSGNHSKQCV